MKKYSYNSKDRIRGKKNISRLFTSGKFFFGKHIHAIVGFSEKKETHIQTGVSVPKKYIPKAVDRNFIKRRVKEAVRLKKNAFPEELIFSNNTLQIFFLWKTKKKMNSADIFLEIEFLNHEILKEIDHIPHI